MERSDGRIDIPTAALRQGRPVHVIYHLIRTGQLASEKVRVPGRDGRSVRKHMIRIQDLDAIDRLRSHDDHVAAIRAAATPLTESQITRIRRALEVRRQ
ncbi:hypothetical protein [Microbacterium sp. cf332]|uniref:hypothetical protein n=1 Tax=Microbacterium sp. cf332 TaxID=1761804 RepID=UPI00088380C2|nr:hypothetical protein [Microbacterium sp. cf332]SDQ11753.1 hypothetical protein SAMN04487847_0439 [Microbacterium sp. cf332]